MALTADAVSVAAALGRMAGEFDREARAWADYPRVSIRCQDTVGLLTDAARHVIRSGDLDWGAGWIQAAQLTLNHLSMARMFRDGKAWQSVLV